VENLTDNGDVTLSLRREELSTICAAPLAALRALILQALSMAGVDVSEVHGVELLGGGGRMQAVQAVVSSLFDASVVVGAKLDDCSVALGASLLLVNNVPSMVVEGGMGMSAADIQSSQAKELELQGVDAEVRALLAARNALEAYVLEMRGAPKRKHGQSIDAKALNSILDSCEDWIYENCSPDSTTDTVTLLKKTEEVRGAASALCVQYYQDKETERISLEKSLEDEAKKAQIEK
jgi:molecular chaperone DnaK (HSP70)